MNSLQYNNIFKRKKQDKNFPNPISFFLEKLNSSVWSKNIDFQLVHIFVSVPEFRSVFLRGWLSKKRTKQFVFTIKFI